MKSAQIYGATLELVQGDITQQSVDAIANAANSGLRGGGGVDGAIHRAGGPTIMDECRKIGGCPTGSAVATGAGNLDAKFVFHAVGPIWHGGNSGEAEKLAGAYATCMQLAEEKGISSIAFPSISTGVYGYPVDAAAAIALKTVANSLKNSKSVKLVRFVLFDSGTFAAYGKALAKITSAS